MKTHITSALLEAVALDAMAMALVEDDMRSGFSVEEEIGY